MDAGIKIGNDPGTVAATAEAIASILAAASESRSDREVTVAALKAFTRASSISYTTISGCQVTSNDSHYSLETEPLDDEADDR